MGLAFTTVEREQLIVLDQWLAELRGAAPAELRAARGSGGSVPKERTNDEQCYALFERTLSLIWQGNISDEQGKTLLRNLLCKDPKS